MDHGDREARRRDHRTQNGDPAHVETASSRVTCTMCRIWENYCLEQRKPIDGRTRGSATSSVIPLRSRQMSGFIFRVGPDLSPLDVAVANRVAHQPLARRELRAARLHL